MPYRRFIELSRYIRFDDGRTPEFRQRTDKTTTIRDVWNFLNQNLANNYEPHENITVDDNTVSKCSGHVIQRQLTKTELLLVTTNISKVKKNMHRITFSAGLNLNQFLEPFLYFI